MIKWMMSVWLMTGLYIVSIAHDTQVNIDSQPLVMRDCSGGFIRHDFDHITSVRKKPITKFESNGAGIAVGDLNNDDRPEVVIANLDGAESIFWNEGDLTFRKQRFDIPGQVHAIALVDVDADGWLDIAVTTQRGYPNWWKNERDGRFSLGVLKGVDHYAYTLNWDDMDADGDLDLITGSYDAELNLILSNDVLLNSQKVGAFYYENTPEGFVETRLTDKAQTLAIAVMDLNGDGRKDIALGNDFSEPDRYFVADGDTWQAVTPFEVTTRNTMGFAIGDIANDGTPELFAVDALPYNSDVFEQAFWEDVATQMTSVDLPAGDVQAPQNVLQQFDNGRFRDVASAYQLTQSGWSWSTEFGDLDSDGFLDVYVVNGMIDFGLFADLPNGELVEQNQAFRNHEGQRFEPAPQWQLGATESGRGMTMADLDADGDLDIVINNLTTAAVLFENQVCGVGDKLIFSLRHPNSQNTFGIGATITVYTNNGNYQRRVEAVSGFLSGHSSDIHVGLPLNSIIERVEILWADHTLTVLDAVQAGAHYWITRLN